MENSFNTGNQIGEHKPQFSSNQVKPISRHQTSNVSSCQKKLWKKIDTSLKKSNKTIDKGKNKVYTKIVNK